jgi:hypothetical protein
MGRAKPAGSPSPAGCRAKRAHAVRPPPPQATTLGRRVFLILAVTISAYVASYAWFRSGHVEVWERDGRAYVIYPAESRVLLYFYRPMAHLDQGITGTGTHLGPHHE